MSAELQVIDRKLPAIISEIKKLHAEFELGEIKLRHTQDEMYELAWMIGGKLSELKDRVGHGNWYIFLTENLSSLGSNKAQTCKNAERYMKFFRSNPWNSTDFDIEQVDRDSKRKLMWYYVPAKKRIEIDGDHKDSPVAHPLTARNQFEKWDRQQRTGQIAPLSIEILRHDLLPMFLRIAELMGIVYSLNALSAHCNDS